MQVTLRLLIFAQIASVVLGILVGLISALRQYSAFDYVMTGFAFFFFSIPTFVLASLLKQFLAIKINPWFRQPSLSLPVIVVFLILGVLCGIGVMRNHYRYEREKPLSKVLLGGAAGLAVVLAGLLVFRLGWQGNTYRKGNPKPLIPTQSEVTPGFKGTVMERWQDFFWHALLPSLTLITISFAGYSRFMRASMLETMNSDYVRTARSKGISEGRTVFRHAFRNALIPLTTQVALDFGGLLAGAIITETVFGWAGMGRFFTDALGKREPFPIMAFVMVTALAVVAFNLVADILYARLDPRIRLD
jgi:peptide/nickel transport system permease protein